MAKNGGKNMRLLIIGSLLVIALATAARGMKREKTSCIGGNSCNKYNGRVFSRLGVKRHMETIFSVFNKLEKEKMTNEKKDSCRGDNSCYSGYGSEDVSSTSCNGNAACSMMGETQGIQVN